MGKLATLRPRVQTQDSRLAGMPVGRPEHGQGLYTYRWKQASKAFLRAHPLCQCPDCDEGRKRVTASTVVDHHVPHRGNVQLFWDVSNWRAMAKPCHDRKTVNEDGGFGR